MAEPGREWTYANHWFILAGLLGTAIVMLAVGLLGVLEVPGEEMAMGASVLLSLGIFLAVFTLVAIFPRLLRRGGKTYRLVVDRSVEEVEASVRKALEADGREVRLVSFRRRAGPEPRFLQPVGEATGFLVVPLSRRETGLQNVERTELVQTGISDLADGGARRLRELVSSRLLAEGEGTR